RLYNCHSHLFDSRRIQPPSLHLFSYHTATTEIYTLSLHDALPISNGFETASTEISLPTSLFLLAGDRTLKLFDGSTGMKLFTFRSEEHTSELQSRENLVCRLLLEKKNKK